MDQTKQPLLKLSVLWLTRICVPQCERVNLNLIFYISCLFFVQFEIKRTRLDEKRNREQL